ncbi:cell wall protein PhiA [Xylariomycetidae sp. FL0641]|nr:cell wall protein PhiA [Xylariomycetidae sp. FL0641]
MLFNAAALSLLAGAAVAMPAPQPIPADAKFTLQIDNSNAALDYAGVSAANKELFVKLAGKQGANCDTGNSVSTATFYMKDGNLFLFGNLNQEMFADLSGMGQGIMQYTTGDEGKPKNAQRGTFALDDTTHILTLDGNGFVACPNDDGSWILLADAGISEPTGRKGCVNVNLKANEATAPVSCVYSH